MTDPKDIQLFFPSLGFIGAGNMAGALLRAVTSKGLLRPHRLMAIDAVPGKAQELAEELGIRVANNMGELFVGRSSVVLATKPQDLMKALEEARPFFKPDHRLISICAGITTAKIEAALAPAEARVIRVMPNTPALIGEGAAGIAKGKYATDEDVQAAVALFQAVGVAFVVEERLLDAITALSGSGPGYVFLLMEHFTAAGIKLGLEPGLARELTLQTFLGSAKMSAQSKESFEELRRRVTSPGGTTAAAIEVFGKRGLEEIISEALTRARDRSVELSGQ